jgi:signal transduction histidine kinase
MAQTLATPSVTPLRDRRLLNLTVYVALCAIVIIGLVLIPSRPAQLATVAFCLAFGLLDSFVLRRVVSQQGAIIYLTAQTALVAAIMAVSGVSDPFNFLLFVLSIQAASLLPTRTAIASTALLFLVSAGAALVLRGGEAGINILFNASAFAFTSVYGHTLRQVELARRQNEALLGELREAQHQLRALAADEERGRIARDLHDSAKQQAFALSAQLDAARSRLRQSPEAAERHLLQAEQLADSLRQELAALILDLRPPALGDGGLAAALHAYAARWSEHTGIAAEVTIEGKHPPPVAFEGPLLRIAQEALANVGRHSGARRVGIRLELSPSRVGMEIADDGRGFDQEQVRAGVGLASMRERAVALPGGTLAVESRPGAGTRVNVRATL